MIVPLSVTSDTGKRIAVLTPREKNLIWDNLSPTYRFRGDLLLYLYPRIVEAFHIANHPEWYRKENAAVFLPIVPGLGKDRCTIKQRTVVLCNNGVRAIDEFFDHKIKFAAYQNMEEAFKLAAKKADFDTSMISTKMLRKTGISWHLVAYPNQQSQISRSAGHDVKTMNKHYLADGFRKEDRKDMVEEVKGFGDA